MYDLPWNIQQGLRIHITRNKLILKSKAVDGVFMLAHQTTTCKLIAQ